jgi:protein-disulfide isomerase
MVFLVIGLIYLLWMQICTPVYFFHNPRCPHCIAMYNEWNEFKRMCKISLIQPIEIDTTLSQNIELSDKYNIDSVPKIIKIVGGQPIEYNGARLAYNIYNWV